MSISGYFYEIAPSCVRGIENRVKKSPIGFRLAKGFFWSLTGLLFSRGLTLGATIFIARILGKIRYGELGMINSTIGMFGAFACFGLGVTATKYISEFRQYDPVRAGRILGLSGLAAFFTGSFMAVLLFFGAPYLSVHVINAPQLVNVLRISSLVLFINAINGAQTGALSGFEAFKKIAQINIIVGILSFPILICGVYLGALTGIVWSMVVNVGISWLLCHLALREEARKCNIPFSIVNCNQEINILWRFSIPVTLTSLMIGPVTWLCNSILVNRPKGYAELALYSAIYQLYFPILALLAVLPNVYLPILSNQYASGDLHRFRGLVKKMLIFNGLGLLLTSIIFVGISQILLPLYGKDFHSSYILIMLIVFSSSLGAFGGYLNSILVAMHMPWHGFFGNIIWATCYVVLFYSLKNYGAFGMAFSMLISQVFAQLFIEHQMLKKIFI